MQNHVLKAIREAADAAVNPNGYADDPDESDRRALKRARLEAALVAVVVAVTEN